MTRPRSQPAAAAALVSACSPPANPDAPPLRRNRGQQRGRTGPKRRDYSFIRDGIGKLDSGGERAAFIIGMGDLIMPSILVVSANVFIKGWRLLGVINLPALGAILGSLAGLAILLSYVASGKPQAGLPPLNGCTILGFLAGWGLAGFL